MDDRRISFWEALWEAVPKTPMQFLTFWLFLHALIGTKYLCKGHPYKDRYFTSQEIAQGHYLGISATAVYSLALWGVMLFLGFYTYVWLS